MASERAWPTVWLTARSRPPAEIDFRPAAAGRSLKLTGAGCPPLKGPNEMTASSIRLSLVVAMLAGTISALIPLIGMLP